MKEIMFDKPIDLVYCWVDGNDIKWQKLKQFWQKKEGLETITAVNPCRYTDNQELRFSLRSAQMYAPWIRKIFIVTNGQIPKWLNINHPKIQLVTHTEIMPKEALPTFNSCAIETCLTNIPDLSEYFLYANDDTFFDKPVTPDYFFDENENPKIRLKKHNWSQEDIETKLYRHTIYEMAKLIDNQFLTYENTHNISVYRKSYFDACKNEFKNIFNQTTFSRFRSFSNIQRQIVDFWCLKNNKATGIYIDDLTKNQDQLYLGISSRENMNYKIQKNNPTLVCYNDSEYVKKEHREKLKYFLMDKYNQKQEWELPYNETIEPIFEHKNGIVFAPDNRYIKYFAVALQSLIQNSNSNENYDIILLASDTDEKNKYHLKKMLPSNFSLRYFDIESYINNNFSVKFASRSYWSITTYYRIFIPLIMSEYERVAYFDSDMCFNQPITELLTMPFDGKSLIAVIDTVSPIIDFNLDRKKQMTEILGLNHPENYFNAGMTLFNISMIDKDKYIKQCLDILKNIPLLFQDQDLLNIIFEGKTKLLPAKFNSQYHFPIFDSEKFYFASEEYQKDYIDGFNNPVIVHYTSSRKPWHSPLEKNAEIWWHYARQTPFYEEILLRMVQSNTITPNINKEMVKHISNRFKYRLRYLKYKLLKPITFGKLRKKYKQKKKKYKQLLKQIKNYLK